VQLGIGRESPPNLGIADHILLSSSIDLPGDVGDAICNLGHLRARIQYSAGSDWIRDEGSPLLFPISQHLQAHGDSRHGFPKEEGGLIFNFLTIDNHIAREEWTLSLRSALPEMSAQELRHLRYTPPASGIEIFRKSRLFSIRNESKCTKPTI
jgi:hypothetical protein